MNAIQKKSLQLVKEHFSKIDGVAFLKMHESLEHGIGPIVRVLLDTSSFGSFVKTSFVEKYEKQYSCNSLEVRGIESTNNLYLVNDEIYFEQLAA